MSLSSIWECIFLAVIISSRQSHEEQFLVMTLKSADCIFLVTCLRKFCQMHSPQSGLFQLFYNRSHSLHYSLLKTGIATNMVIVFWSFPGWPRFFFFFKWKVEKMELSSVSENEWYSVQNWWWWVKHL